MSVNPEVIGSAAGVIGLFTFIPQIITIIRTKDTKAISLVTYIIMFVSIALWIVYGFMIEKMPLIIPNSFIITCVGLIIFIKIRNIQKGIDEGLFSFLKNQKQR